MFDTLQLAKKLKDCGVFGVSSDVYLNYAMINRRKWEVEGDEITAGMISRLKEPANDVGRHQHTIPSMDIIVEDSGAMDLDSIILENEDLDDTSVGDKYDDENYVDC